MDNLPEVAGPEQKRLSFKEKLKWTGMTLVLYFVLGMIPLFGLGHNALERFKYLSIIFGAKFGSLISLGIGPIVTASIVLQLLNGSGILKFDLTTHEGKRKFQGLQKLLSIFFIIFEAFIYVYMGGLSPGTHFNTATGSLLVPAIGQQLPATVMALAPSVVFSLKMLLIFQLCLGGLMIMFMDEIVSKWGFGSGISLFIAAGVSQEIMIQSLNWMKPVVSGVVQTGAYSIGIIPSLFQAIKAGDPTTALLNTVKLAATVIVFVMAVYAQAMKVEIPLSFGRVRGYGVRWPLAFIYTSNIPVILVAALIANVQLLAKFLENWGMPLLGTFSSQGAPNSGFIYWLYSPNLVQAIIEKKTLLLGTEYGQAAVYLIFMVVGAVIFSIFWMQTSGMDARSQANQIMSSGLQIPGFRRDPRVLERMLNRYIWPLTIMGAIAVGILAAVADLTGALSRGTGILLAVMIIYKLYEEISKQHMMDMHPMMRKMME